MVRGLLDSRTLAVGLALTRDASRPPRPTGEAVAALLAAAIGMLTLAFVNQLAVGSTSFAAWLHRLGTLSLPGGQAIGPYAGKETLSVSAWLVSWAILHPVLRTREISLSRWLVVFLLMVGVATTFLWPPVFRFLAGQ